MSPTNPWPRSRCRRSKVSTTTTCPERVLVSRLKSSARMGALVDDKNTCWPSPAWSLLCSGFWGKKEMLFGSRASGDFRVGHLMLCCAPHSCAPGAVGAANVLCARRGRQGLPRNTSRGLCSGVERQRQTPGRRRSAEQDRQRGCARAVDSHAPVTTCREAAPGSAGSWPCACGLL